MNLEVWEFPGQLDLCDPSFDMFHNISSLIWVIDAQAEYRESLRLLHDIITLTRSHNPNVNVEVFIHKVDAISLDYQHEIRGDITQIIESELEDDGQNNDGISYHFTSIYDHSIQEALSNTIQKVIPHVATLERIIDLLCASSKIHKAFLFATSSKIFIATDSSPVDLGAFGICSDFIDFVGDISDIYGYSSSP